MPNIEIRIQTVVLVALLLLLALAAPFLTGLVPEGQPVPVLAAEETPQEVVLTLACFSLLVQGILIHPPVGQTPARTIASVRTRGHG